MNDINFSKTSFLGKEFNNIIEKNKLFLFIPYSDYEYFRENEYIIFYDHRCNINKFFPNLKTKICTIKIPDDANVEVIGDENGKEKKRLRNFYTFGENIYKTDKVILNTIYENEEEFYKMIYKYDNKNSINYFIELFQKLLKYSTDLCDINFDESVMKLIKFLPERLINLNFFLNIAKIVSYRRLFEPKKYTPKDKFYKLIEYLPPKINNFYFYKGLIELGGIFLKFVPNRFKTYELCFDAIIDEPSVISYITNEILDEKIYLEALKGDISLINNLPNKFKYYNFYFKVIKINGIYLNYVPNNFKDYKMCYISVILNGNALKYIPENKRNKEICLEAVKENGKALKYVPNKIMSYDICLEAIKNNPLAIEFIPFDLLENLETHIIDDHGNKIDNEKLCLIAVEKDGCALQFIPKKYKTQKVCFQAIDSDGFALFFL
jgi:hypothetical protein